MIEPLFTRKFIALWTFQFVTFFSAFQLLPVIPLRIVALGGGTSMAGVFLFVYTMSSAFSAPIMGTIADAVGRRRMLVIASVLFVVFSLAYGIVPWLPLVWVIAIVHGALWSSLLSAAGAIMADYIPLSRRTEGMAYWGMAPSAAIAIAPAVGLWVHGFGWFTLCAEIAIISALNAIWASRLSGGELATNAKMPRVREFWDMRVVQATLSLTAISFGYGGITSCVALLSHERGITPESLFFTTFAVAVLLVRVFTSKLGDRFGPKVLIYPALAAIPISFAVLARASNRAEMMIAAVLFGIGLGASFPAFMTFIMAHTSDDRRARTFGSVIWAFDTGIGLGSIVIGAIGGRWSLGFAFNIAAILACASIPIFLFTSRGLVRGTAVAPATEHAGT